MNNIINDEYIIKYFYKGDKINVNKYKTITPKIQDYLINRFPDSQSIKETINRIKYQIFKRPVCPICGNSVKYRSLNIFNTHCSYKCAAINKKTIAKREQTCVTKYGVSNISQLQKIKNKIKTTIINKYKVEHIMQLPDIIEKRKQTNIKKYGVPYYIQSKIAKKQYKQTYLRKYGVAHMFQSPVIKNKIKQTITYRYGNSNYRNIKKAQLTCLNKYSETNWFKSKAGKSFLKNNYINTIFKRQQTMLYKYDCKYALQNTKLRIKRINTLKSNKTIGKHISYNEQQCYNILKTKFNIVIQQYTSDVYPWACDFYIPSLDLYIEYNEFWTHGKHTFNSNNIEDITLLNIWKKHAIHSKFYQNAIYTWTILDTNKLNTFINNNLNYKIFWNLKEVKDWIKNYNIN